MFNYHNNESLRKLVVGFGNLFNDMYVGKYNKNNTLVEKDRVPLTYGPKEKFIRRIKEVSTISDVTRSRITLPRMGFEMLGMSYDPTRKANKLRKTGGTITNGAQAYNYAEVPYLVNFGLYTFTRNIEENLQLVEQILPIFAPEFIISMNFNDLNKKVNVPIILTSSGISEIYEGDFSETRSITTTFSFIAKTYVYGEIKEQGVVENAELRMFEGGFEPDTDPESDLDQDGGTPGFGSGTPIPKPPPAVRPTNAIGIREIKEPIGIDSETVDTISRGPLAVSGYYPLYTTASGAVAASPHPTIVREGETTVGYHTHALDKTIYYMPNGLVMNKTMFHGNYPDLEPGPEIIDDPVEYSPPLIIGAGGNNVAWRSEQMLDGNPESLFFTIGDFFSADYRTMTLEEYDAKTDESIREAIQFNLNQLDARGVVRNSYLNENTTGWIMHNIEHPTSFGQIRFWDDEKINLWSRNAIRRTQIFREFVPNAKIGIWSFGSPVNPTAEINYVGNVITPPGYPDGIDSGLYFRNKHVEKSVKASQVEYNGETLFEAIHWLAPTFYQTTGEPGTDPRQRTIDGQRTDHAKQICDAIFAANGERKPVVGLYAQNYQIGPNEGRWAGELNSIEMAEMIGYADHSALWYYPTSYMDSTFENCRDRLEYDVDNRLEGIDTYDTYVSPDADVDPDVDPDPVGGIDDRPDDDRPDDDIADVTIGDAPFKPVPDFEPVPPTIKPPGFVAPDTEDGDSDGGGTVPEPGGTDDDSDDGGTVPEPGGTDDDSDGGGTVPEPGGTDDDSGSGTIPQPRSGGSGYGY